MGISYALLPPLNALPLSLYVPDWGGAEATDDIELFTNWKFVTNLSGWTAINTGGSSFAYNADNDVTLTWDGSNATSLTQGFATRIGHNYTVRIAFRSITTMTVRLDIGTTLGGFDILNGSGLAPGVVYKNFVATSTTTYIRIRGSGSAGSASLYSASAKFGGIPIDWVQGGSGNGRDLELYHRVTALGIDPRTGIQYVRTKFSGTSGSGGTGTLSYHFKEANEVAAADGQTWTAALWNRLIAGGMTGFGSVQLAMYATNGSATLNPSVKSQQITNSASFVRDRITGTISNATAADLFSSVEYTYFADSAISIENDFGFVDLVQTA